MTSPSEYEVDDTSPLITYVPVVDISVTRDLTSGWLPFYTNVGFAPTVGALGNGTSYHVTSIDGASLSLTWNGTGIKLLGNATNAGYDIMLDGFLVQPNSSAPADNVLATFRNLSNTQHTVTLISRTSVNVSPDSVIAFDKAKVEYPPPGNGKSIMSRPLHVTEITFNGTWKNTTSLAGSQSLYHMSSAAGDRASFRFNGTGISLFGHTSPVSGSYRVVLDGVASSLSGRSTFTQPDTLLFFSMGLDAGVLHNLVLFNDESKLLAVRSDGFEVTTSQPITPISPSMPPSSTSPSPTISSSSTSRPSTNALIFYKGTIAALVLAGVLALFAICGSLFYFLFWRPRARRKRQERRAILRQRRKLESVRESRKEDKDRRYLDEEQDFGYPLIGPYPPEKSEPLTDLPMNTLVIGKRSKGKEKAIEADLSNVTLEIELPNLPRSPSAPSLRKRAASWGSTLDIRNVTPCHKSGDTVPSNHARPPSQDQLLVPEDAGSTEEFGYDNNFPYGEMAALALSPRTSDLGSRQGSWSGRAGRGGRAGNGEGRVVLNVRELGPLQVDFSDASSRRTREQSGSTTPAKSKPPGKPKGSRSMRPRSARRREAQSSGEGTGKEKSEDSPSDQRRILFAPSIPEGSTTERQSFLDLSSSNPSTRSQTSRGSQSNASGSDRKKRSSDNSAPSLKTAPSGPLQQPASRWSATTVPSIRQIPPSPSPDDEQSQESPQLPHPYGSPLVPIYPHLAPLEGGQQELSPTESLPVTVSDIHFRHSMSDRASVLPSARHSRSLSPTDSHPSPYVPLTGLARSLHTRYHPVSPNLGETGRASPPLIVQRVLGMSSTPPTSQTTSTSGSSPGGGVSRPPSLPVADTPRPGPRSPSLQGFLSSGLRIPSSFSRSKTSLKPE